VSPGRPPLSGHTRVVGVIGDPVSHSLSPTLHNAAFEALGLDWVYVAFPVQRGRGADAVAAVRALGLAGLNVTMPHKEDVAGACDELSADAAALRSVNTVVGRADGSTFGDSTDGPGFLDALADEGIEVGGTPVLVLGAGGAARAVVRALGDAGAGDIAVLNRTRSKAETAAALAGGAGRVGGPDDVVAAEIVVNATSVGMGEGGSIPVDPGLLHAGQLVVDLVYFPLRTPLLAAAEAAGATGLDGLGMLVHQAGHAFRQWTGQAPPLAAMAEAARSGLVATGTPEKSGTRD